MGHKTLKISKDTYEALTNRKKDHESFTEANLKLPRDADRGTPLPPQVPGARRGFHGKYLII